MSGIILLRRVLRAAEIVENTFNVLNIFVSDLPGSSMIAVIAAVAVVLIEALKATDTDAAADIHHKQHDQNQQQQHTKNSQPENFANFLLVAIGFFVFMFSARVVFLFHTHQQNRHLNLNGAANTRVPLGILDRLRGRNQGNNEYQTLLVAGQHVGRAPASELTISRLSVFVLPHKKSHSSKREKKKKKKDKKRFKHVADSDEENLDSNRVRSTRRSTRRMSAPKRLTRARTSTTRSGLPSTEVMDSPSIRAGNTNEERSGRTRRGLRMVRSAGVNNLPSVTTSSVSSLFSRRASNNNRNSSRNRRVLTNLGTDQGQELRSIDPNDDNSETPNESSNRISSSQPSSLRRQRRRRAGASQENEFPISEVVTQESTSPSSLLKSNSITSNMCQSRGSLCSEVTSESTYSGFCAVCLTSAHGEVVVALPCLHMYHEDCIKQWLRVRAVCPVCKIPVM